LFRPSLVSGVGYCARDAKRDPLSGSEQRPCWTESPAAAVDGFFDPAATSVELPLFEPGLHEVR
jgi:hypothetical protein